MNYLYLLIDLATISVPLLFSFYYKINFYKHYKAILPAIVLPAIVFLIWDIAFTSKGVWGFNPTYLTGTYFFNLPLEEVLFFICIPYACLFTYFCLTLFFSLEWSSSLLKITVTVLAIALLLTGMFFYDRMYTATTFLSLGCLLLLMMYVVKASWLGGLLSVYTILLIPFCIVNGILTGTGLDQPVVWYNDEETMGVRLLTIPLEDVFYGFELVLLNVFVYKRFSN